MKQRFIIRPDHTPEELTEIHNEILHLNPHIRVNFRWGSFTEYSVRLKEAHMRTIAAHELPPGRTYRLAFGCEDGDLTIDPQWYDQETREWHTMAHYAGPPEAAIERAVSFLRQEHPDAEALIQIDARLLAEGDRDAR